MATKIVERILAPLPPHMVGDGFRVHNFFPNGYSLGERRMSPFYLLDYNSKIDFPPSERPRGVGVHPHRGFETVTLSYHGKIAHHDSFGNSGIIGEGDVQWMTAASGLLHKEYHEENFSKQGGPFQMVQLWVNLPAKYKMASPKYQAITHDEMAVYRLPEKNGFVEVVAGSFKNARGPAATFSPIEMYNIHLHKGGKVSFDLPSNYNTGILLIRGSVLLADSAFVAADHFILFKNEGETIELAADEESILLVLSGEPIDEPIAAYGPFLMNNAEELEAAMDDFRNGKFGVLKN